MKLTDNSPHSAVQREAISAGLATLVTSGHPRARLTMACGTGKTFTQLKLSEALLEASGTGPRRILVLVPSLSLVRQSRDEWASSHALGADYDSLCVCSDPSLKAGILQDSGEDHVDLSPEDLAELGVNAASTSAAADIARINAWLDAREKGPGGSANATCVIFTTYQSAKVVGMAMAARAAGDRAIDVGVFDEAHRTAGAGGKPFSFALSDKNISIRKRVFFTATERVRDTSRAAQAQDEDDGLVTMDDETVYGPRAYSLSFRQAAERGLTVPVKIIISVVDDEAIARQNLGERAVRAADGQRLQARGVANLSAVSRAMAEMRLQKVITFHGGVDAANEFSKLPADAGAPGAGQAQLPGLQLLHVSGRQGAAHRREQMQRYAQATVPSVISNARCLTEGVNVPATDMVAFMDPKRGAVDIVQAIGRAQRKAPGKTVGYVLLPLHVSVRPGESDQQVLDRAAKDFQQIRDVLSALAENDEAFMAEVRRTVAANATSPQGAGASFGELPVILMSDGRGGTLRAEELARAISTRVIGELLGDFDVRWEKHFAALVKFKEQFGHCDVPQGYETAVGLTLGVWLSNQRVKAKKPNYPNERRARLEALGVQWNVMDAEFEKHFAALVAFKSKEGHCDVPAYHVTPDGIKLGRWLSKQRMAVKKPTYPSERKGRLEALGVQWSVMDAEFDKHVAALVAFKAKEGHCDVPKNHITPDGIKLGEWLSRQRRAAKKPDYPNDRRERMEALGVRWSVKGQLAVPAPKQTTFSDNLDQLAKFANAHGTCDVPLDHELYLWNHEQILAAEQGRLPPDHLQQLIAVGLIEQPDESPRQAMRG